MEKVGRELASSIGCDGLRHSHAGYPSRDHGPQDCLRWCVWKWNSDGPSCESIDDRQDVRMSVGCWQWSDKVHVDVLKTTAWERETRWGCRGMSMNLALLTRKTFSVPCSDVLVHVGHTNRWRIIFEFARAPGCERECILRNTLWRKFCGTNGLCVPVEVSTQMLPWLNGNGTSTIFKDGMSVRSEWSGILQFPVSRPLLSTSVRDCISHDVALSLDMQDFCRELADVFQLPWWVPAGSALGGECEWLVVNGELSPLQNERKCLTARHTASNSRPKVLYLVSAGLNFLE